MKYEFLHSFNNVIFDYDGTISRIPINWKKIRSEFLSFAHKTFDYNFDNSLRIDEMEHILLSQTSSNPDKIFSFRNTIEKNYNGKHENNKDLIKFIREANNCLFIVSNNLQSTVASNISDLGIMHKFRKIIGCDTYYSIKPSILSWQNLVNEFDLKITDTLIVGDSPTIDGFYAKKIGLPYFQVPSFT